jgi:cell division protein FtsW
MQIRHKSQAPPYIYPGMLQSPSLAKIGGQGLWFPVFALTAFGLLFVYSASSIYALENFDSEFFFVKKQAVSVVLGIFAAAVGLLFNVDRMQKWTREIFFISLALLACTKVPGIGHQVNGAWRWVRLGPLTAQPAEITKVAAVVYLASVLANRDQSWKKALPVLAVFPILLVQPDFGSSVVILAAISLILFVHGLPLRYFALAILGFLPVLIAVLVLAPYRLQRLVTFLDPFADPLGSGFQVIQSFLAVASGGLFGKGLGNSTQKLFFLPEAHTDFVVAVVGEEMGFAGVCVLLAIIGLLFFALLNILLSLENRFHLLLGTGLFALLAGNTLVNLGMVVGILPTKGLPLPFVSAGGTSYILSMYAVGLFGQLYHRQLANRSRSIIETDSF